MSDDKDLPVLMIVEDDEGLQRQLKWAYEGYRVVQATTREQAIELLRLHEPAVVTLDLGLPPDPDGTSEGFATLSEILALKPDTKVIVASGHGARESALRAIALGAYDFYRKPVDIDDLGLIVARAFHLHEIEAENRRLEAGGGDPATVLGSIITAAPEMLKVARTIERVAAADVSVMLLGASGTGKELLAKAVHELSPRKRGEFVAIMGASGSGKSTLLHLLAGLDRPDAGRVRVAGQDLGSLDDTATTIFRRRKIGVVFQAFNLLGMLSARENVALPLVVAGVAHRDIGKRVRAALDKVGLLNRERAAPITLSGGEQQRLCIARAIVNRPATLIADEPTGNLDPGYAQTIIDLFKSFNQVGVTVLLATHDETGLARLKCRRINLDHGKLAA